jgi:putative endonuclease
MITSLMRRVLEHRAMKPGAHTAHYNIMRLIYFERYQYVDKAIARENELKSWTRAKKVALVETVNPTWEDLAAGGEGRRALASLAREAGSSLRSEWKGKGKNRGKRKGGSDSVSS